MRLVIVAAALAAVLAVFQGACSRSSSQPGPSSPERGPGERQSITAAACEQQGGKVIGDIGDGAIHRPDYRCPDSGEPPIGSIAPEPGAPAAVEGAVCCK